jgi:taurine dioxygenase
MTQRQMRYARRDEERVELGDAGPLVFRPIAAPFGAMVENIDLHAAATPGQVAALRAALDTYSLLCFPDQDLEPADEMRVMRYFNEVADPIGETVRGVPGFPEIVVISNIVLEDGTPVGYANKAGMEWHTDGSGWLLPPVASSLYAIETPATGGETYFASGYAAFETLPEKERRYLEGMIARYSYVTLQRWLIEAAGSTDFFTEEEEARYPDVDWPLVRTHPVTGRKALWFSIEEIIDIDGMGREAARELLLGLIDHMTATPHVVYRHDWNPRELVLWDNRALMHSVCEYNYEGQRRLMHQITGKDLDFAV